MQIKVQVERCGSDACQKSAQVINARQALISRNLLDGHRLGQISREIHIQAFGDSQPISNQLQRDNVQQPLKTVNSLRNLNLLRQLRREFGIVGIANDDRATFASND